MSFPLFRWLSGRTGTDPSNRAFPVAWRAILLQNVSHYALLTDDEAQYLGDMLAAFIEEKHWEGCGGLELTDEIRVTIAGQACLLLLGLPHRLYARVETILVYPSAFRPPPSELSPLSAPRIVSVPTFRSGEAQQRGLVVLAWDAVRRGARHPELGHNVVYHEFAHQLDMLDGRADDVPPLPDRAAYERWTSVFRSEYERLRSDVDAGRGTVLDPYGLTGEGELFAVVTEAFFDQPERLRAAHPKLYAVVADFYRQNPAERRARFAPRHPRR